jgi:ABC-type lipoprotein export system ATPase subunit
VGLRDARERVIPWLERVGLGERLEYAAGRLSGGERQRVAIARVLACEPRLILADEPTGNLDSARSKEIVELLRSISHDRGAMVVLVTHDAEIATLADRHYALRDGVLVDGETSIETPHSSATRR